MADITAVLRGGSRDGETARVDESTVRLRAASLAPGLLDVYEATEERVQLDSRQGEATVYEFADQESIEGLAPELINMPSSGGRTGPLDEEPAP